MHLPKNSLALLHKTFHTLAGTYNENSLEEIKSELSNCLIMPNQMIYGVAYRPYNVFFSKNVEKLLGLGYEDKDVSSMIQLIHPEDEEFVTRAIDESFKQMAKSREMALDTIFSLEYRLKHAKGHLMTIQRGTRFVRVDQHNKPMISLSVVTDISLLKESNFKAKAFLHNPQTGEVFFSFTNNHILGTNISAREKQVLQLISQGLSSKEICHKLFISKHTVDGHRRSLLRKTSLTNTAELVTFALLHGIIDG